MSTAMTRILTLKQAGRQSEVTVHVFWPSEDASAWDSRWEILWPDRQRRNSARGADAVQALQNALQMVGAELYSSEEHRSGRLRWHDGWIGYGFPLPGGSRALLIGDDAKHL